MTYKFTKIIYLFELFRKQYSSTNHSISDDELEKIYMFELTDVEQMVLWAWETDLAIGRVETNDEKLAEDIRWSGQYKWVESWRPHFKYIGDYKHHLEEVMFNCANYHGIDHVISDPFQYEFSWLLNFSEDMYNRLIGRHLPKAESKQKYHSLVG